MMIQGVVTRISTKKDSAGNTDKDYGEVEITYHTSNNSAIFKTEMRMDDLEKYHLMQPVEIELMPIVS